MNLVRLAIALLCLAMSATGAAAQDSALRVEVSLAPFAFPGPVLAKPRSTMLVTVHVTHPPVTAALEEKVGIIINVFTQKGKHVTDIHHKVNIKAAGLNTALAYEVVSRVELEPGRYRFKVGAGTSDGKTGHAATDVVVPRYGRNTLAASGVVLTATPRPYAVPVEGVKDLVSVVPTAVRAFTAEHSASAFLRVYRFGERTPVPVHVSATILDARNTTVFTAQQELDPNTFLAFFGGYRADHRVALPIATLPPGEYVLRLAVAAGRAKTAPDPVPFTVAPAGR